MMLNAYMFPRIYLGRPTRPARLYLLSQSFADNLQCQEAKFSLEGLTKLTCTAHWDVE
jgi:hypothetical protein